VSQHREFIFKYSKHMSGRKEGLEDSWAQDVGKEDKGNLQRRGQCGNYTCFLFLRQGLVM
jgi:hypothetical protein